jgi:hypothetical protein
MQHVIFGILLLLLGVWGIVSHWYQFLDLLWVLIPLVLLVGGIVSILAGVSGVQRGALRSRR